MVNESYLCLVGLANCQAIDATQSVGFFVDWIGIATAVGIAITFSQFIESERLYYFIFKHSFSKNLTFYCLALSLVAISISKFLPFWQKEAVPLFGYPFFWEIISVFLLLLGLGRILEVAFLTEKFIPRYSKESKNIYDIATHIVFISQQEEDLEALTKILNYKKTVINWRAIRELKFNSCLKKISNFEEILIAASEYRVEIPGVKPKQYSENTKLTLPLLDSILSEPIFIKFIVTSNCNLLFQFVDVSTELQLWRYGVGRAFAKSLVYELLNSEDSYISRKKYDFFGKNDTPIAQQVRNHIFGNLEFANGYDVFPQIQDPEKNLTLIQNYCQCLGTSIRAYLDNNQGGFGDQCAISDMLISALGTQTLISSLLTNLHRLNGLRGQNKIDDTEYFQLTFEIESLFRSIHYDLSNNSATLSEMENRLFTRSDRGPFSFTYGMAVVALNYLQAFKTRAPLKPFRNTIFAIDWLFYPEYGGHEIFKKISVKMLELIKENIDLYDKSDWPKISLFRVLLSIYTHRLLEINQSKDGEIAFYVQQEFSNYFANKALESTDNAKRFLPEDMECDFKKKKIYYIKSDAKRLLVFDSKTGLMKSSKK